MYFYYKRYNLSILIFVVGPSNYNYTGNKFREMIKIKIMNSVNRSAGVQEKGEGVSLTPHYHFLPLHRHL